MNLKYPIYSPGDEVINTSAIWGFDMSRASRETVLAQPFSVAVIPALYNDSSVWPGSQFATQLPEVFAQTFEQFDLVLFTVPEPQNFDYVLNWIAKQNVRCHAVIYGTRDLAGEPPSINRWYHPYWLAHFIRNNQWHDLADSQPQFDFDCLLGARRPHRDFVMSSMVLSGQLDRNVVTYRDVFRGGYVDSSAQMAHLRTQAQMPWPYVSPNLDPTWEVADCVTNLTSFSTPWQIYRNTRYSIVCESIGQGSTFFMTEKIMKVLWAQRVFVLFGIQGYLAELQRQGFQTFGDIIDESYDKIENPWERWQAAWQASQRLAAMDYESVMSATAHRRLHNFHNLSRIHVQHSHEVNKLLASLIASEHQN